jgi:hypothetical protein
MNMHEHDDDFDLRLSKRERLLPQFDAELDGPDADTDRLLIARARMAEHPVQLRSPASKTFRAPHWAVPVGLAATLVLSFTLLLQTSAPAAMPEPHSEPVVPPTVTVNGAVNDSMISRERTSVRAEVVVEPAVLAKAIPAVPPPPPPAMNTAAAADTSADVAAVAMAAAPAPAEAAAGSAAAGSDAERVAGAPLAPHVWLQRIERLRSRGLDTETRQELQAFRQQYPDHPLPAALQALLPAP